MIYFRVKLENIACYIAKYITIALFRFPVRTVNTIFKLEKLMMFKSVDLKIVLITQYANDV